MGWISLVLSLGAPWTGNPPPPHTHTADSSTGTGQGPRVTISLAQDSVSLKHVATFPNMRAPEVWAWWTQF